MNDELLFYIKWEETTAAERFVQLYRYKNGILRRVFYYSSSAASLNDRVQYVNTGADRQTVFTDIFSGVKAEDFSKNYKDILYSSQHLQ